MNRLKNYAQRFCFHKLEQLRTKQQLKIIQQNSIEEEERDLVKFPARLLSASVDHILCRKCVGDLFSELKSKNLLPDSNVDLKCNICNEKHKIVYKKFCTLIKNKDGGCCFIF